MVSSINDIPWNTLHDVFVAFSNIHWRNININCRHVEGGMGSVSMAISNAAKEAGVHIATNAEVFYFSMQLWITWYSLQKQVQI